MPHEGREKSRLFLCKNICLSQEMACISSQQERTHGHGKEKQTITIPYKEKDV